jgi:cytochrome c oxidase assembly protein subunit 15
MALLVLTALLLTGLALRRHGDAARRIGHGLLLLAGWQLLSGLSNVVLGWPLAAALAHTAGAAALMAWIAAALARSPRAAPAMATSAAPAPFGTPLHS